MKNIKRIAFYICVFSVFFVLGCASTPKASNDENNAEIAAQALILNKRCPIQLDELTILMSVSSNENTIIYNYDAKLTPEEFETVCSLLKRNVIKVARSNPTARDDLLRLKARCEYHYFNDSVYLGSFCVENNEW